MSNLNDYTKNEQEAYRLLLLAKKQQEQIDGLLTAQKLQQEKTERSTRDLVKTVVEKTADEIRAEAKAVENNFKRLSWIHYVGFFIGQIVVFCALVLGIFLYLPNYKAVQQQKDFLNQYRGLNEETVSQCDNQVCVRVNPEKCHYSNKSGNYCVILK